MKGCLISGASLAFGLGWLLLSHSCLEGSEWVFGDPKERVASWILRTEERLQKQKNLYDSLLLYEEHKQGVMEEDLGSAKGSAAGLIQLSRDLRLRIRELGCEYMFDQEILSEIDFFASLGSPKIAL